MVGLWQMCFVLSPQINSAALHLPPLYPSVLDISDSAQFVFDAREKTMMLPPLQSPYPCHQQNAIVQLAKFHSVAIAFAAPTNFHFQHTTEHAPYHLITSSRRPFIQQFNPRRRRRPSITVTACADNDNLKDSEPETSSAPSSQQTTILSRILSGFEPTPELFAILSVYFVQGALGISRLAVSFFLKDNLGLSPAESAALTGLSVLPWLIKPLYGFLTDSLPLFGYRRRSYLIAAGLIGASAWLSLATLVDSAPTALAATIAASFSVAISDVVVDSIVVQRVRGLPAERSGALQSLCWGSSAVGGLLSAYFSGSLLEVLGPRQIFAFTSVLPLGTTLLAGLIAENRSSLESASEFVHIVKKRSSALWKALSDPTVFLPAAFIFFWQATPSPESALFFFNTSVLGFGPEFLGRVRLVSSAAALIGLWMYRTYLTRVELKTFMFWCTLLSVPLSMSQVILVTRANVALGVSDQIFALADSAVLTVLGQIAFMPTLVLAARLCPPGVEGTLFAALMSVYNLSGATSTELGALLTHALGVTESNFDNLWILVALCSISYLLPLPLLNLLDSAPKDDALEDAAAIDVDAQPGPSLVGSAVKPPTNQRELSDTEEG